MPAVFSDFEDDANPANGRTIEGRAALSELMSGFRSREPFIFSLRAKGRELIVGTGRGVGCVQFTDEEGLPMMAVGPRAFEEGFVEFLCGGTATPIPTRYCMPPPLVESIAGHFVEHALRSADVPWEAV